VGWRVVVLRDGESHFSLCSAIPMFLISISSGADPNFPVEK